MYRAHVDEYRSFGVEIEAFGVDHYSLMQALGSAGIACDRISYSHDTVRWWKLTSDNSLVGPNSLELVSPILVGSGGLRQVETVMKVLKELGGRVNTSCGFHVHWNVSDFTGKNLQALLRLYSKFEPVIDYLVAPSRRGNTNTYCRSMIKDYTLNWVTDLDPTGRREPSRVVAGFEYLDGNQGRANRYHKLNLLSYSSYGTVEFRQHQGTLSGKKALNWILFTQQLVNKAKGASVSKEVSAKVTLGELIRVLRLAQHNLDCAVLEDNLDGVDPRLVDLRSWMKERYGHFRQGLDDDA